MVGYGRKNNLHGYPTKISYEFLIFPMLTTCPTHLILLNSNILIISGEEYKLWSCCLKISVIFETDVTIFYDTIV
jgi:hypothetical protein